MSREVSGWFSKLHGVFKQGEAAAPEARGASTMTLVCEFPAGLQGAFLPAHRSETHHSAGREREGEGEAWGRETPHDWNQGGGKHLQCGVASLVAMTQQEEKQQPLWCPG